VLKITKYLTFEIIKSYILILLILVSIFSLFLFIEELDNNYPVTSIIEYVILSMPSTAGLLSTLALFIGSILVIGRLNSNKELQILISAGLSIFSFFKKFFSIVIILAIFNLIINEITSPFFFEKSRLVKALASGQTYSNADYNIWLKKENKFVRIEESINGQEFRNISIFTIEDNELMSILFAQEGRLQDGDLVILKKDLFKIYRDNHFINYSKFLEKDEAYKLELNSRQIESLNRDERSMNIIELVKSLIFLSQNGISNNDYVVELVTRATSPLTVIGLIILALPFVLRFDRGTSISKMMIISISIALVFNLVLKIFKVSIISFGLDAYLASFLPLMILCIISSTIILKITSKA